MTTAVLDLPPSDARPPPPADGLDARRRGRARQHGPHRRDHGVDDRRQGHAGSDSLERCTGRPRSCSAPRSARPSCPADGPRGRRPGLAAGYGIGRPRCGDRRDRDRPGASRCSSPDPADRLRQRANQLSRYAAADLYPPDRRATALGIVVWAATVGAIVGPNLVGAERRGRDGARPARRGRRRTSSRSSSSGSPAILSWVRLRPDPYDLADHHGRPETGHWTRVAAPVGPPPPERLGRDRRPGHRPVRDGPDHDDDPAPHDRPRPRPLGRRDRPERAHAGMYAFAPISGRLTDRFGSPPVIYGGMAILAVAGVAGSHRAGRGRPRAARGAVPARFGWNLGYVAGGALLTSGVAIVERTRVQGVADALIWSTAAIASPRLRGARGGRGLRGARGPRRNPRGGAGVVPDRPAGRFGTDAVDGLTRPARRAAPPAARAHPAASSSTTQAASTRAHASTSASGTCSSALWATLTSPGPKITQGVLPSLMNSRMSAP